MEYYNAVIWIILVCAQTPVYVTQYTELTIRDNSTEGHEILNILFKPQSYSIITCFRYDSLADFETDNRFENITPRYKFDIMFVNCFNNATDHRNYQEFSLISMIVKLGLDLSATKRIKIKTQDFGIVDSNIFFRDFDFTQYQYQKLQNIQFTNAAYLPKINCCYIILENAGQINFDDFTRNFLEKVGLTEISISNFTNSNLAKFPSILYLELIDFQLDDYNAFNVPNLFGNNTSLDIIRVENSRKPIILHADVFVGLHNLTHISLNRLKLQTLSKNIFRDQAALNAVQLKNNNIKLLDPDTFINNIRLKVLYLGDDEFLYSEELQHLKLGQATIVHFNDVNVKDVKMLNSILKNPYIGGLQFMEKSSISNIDLLDLVRHTNRSRRLDILVTNIPFRINLTQLQNQKYSDGSSMEQLTTFVSVDITDTLWPTMNCAMDPELFMWCLDGKPNNPQIYLDEYNAAIKFSVNEHLDLTYKILFIDNCSDQCKCYNNPLLDKIYIDCTGRNLRSVPIIPYPTQFITIENIELKLENNLLSDISFDLQDIRVLQKLTLVEFHNNPVLRVNLNKNMAHMKVPLYCFGYTGYLLRGQKTTLYINGENSTIADNLCGIAVTELKAPSKVPPKPKQQIRDVLDSYFHNTTCSMTA